MLHKERSVKHEDIAVETTQCESGWKAENMNRASVSREKASSGPINI